MSNLTLPVISINRHRLTTDGHGVSTLVGAYGCPLSCKYCINSHAWNPDTLKHCKNMTPAELYEATKIDDLYFLATGGGITFGGGESLLHADYISSFRDICGPKWRLTVETSLNVPQKQLLTVLPVIDDYIVDVKDLNPDTYKAYTGKPIDNMLTNLQLLLKEKNPDNIFVRVPLIPNYNTRKDTLLSANTLQNMGFKHIEIFPYVIR